MKRISLCDLESKPFGFTVWFGSEPNRTVHYTDDEPTNRTVTLGSVRLHQFGSVSDILPIPTNINMVRGEPRKWYIDLYDV